MGPRKRSNMENALKAFLEKYGFHTLNMLVSSFIHQAPKFSGDEKLAREIGDAMGMLEIGLKQYSDTH